MKKKMIFVVVILLIGLSMIGFGCFITFSNKKEETIHFEKPKENQKSVLNVDPLKITGKKYSNESVIASSIVSLFPDYYATNKENLKTSIPYQEINSNYTNGNVMISPDYYYFDSIYQKGNKKTNVYYGIMPNEIMPNTEASIYGYDVDDTLEEGFLLNLDDDSNDKTSKIQVQKFAKDAKLLWNTIIDFYDLIPSAHLEDITSSYYGNTELDDGGVVLAYSLYSSYNTGERKEDGSPKLDSRRKILLVTIDGTGQVLKRSVVDDSYIYSGGKTKKNKENIIVYCDKYGPYKIATVTKDGKLKALFEQNELSSYDDILGSGDKYIGLKEDENFQVKTISILSTVGKEIDKFSFPDVIGTKKFLKYDYFYLGNDTLAFTGKEEEKEKGKEENYFNSYVYFVSLSKKEVIKKIKFETNFSIEKVNIDHDNNLSLLLHNSEEEDTMVRIVFDKKGNKIEENRMEYFENFDTEIHFVKGNILSLSNIYLDGEKKSLLIFYKLKEEGSMSSSVGGSKNQ